jgi:hypothetical protein
MRHPSLAASFAAAITTALAAAVAPTTATAATAVSPEGRLASSPHVMVAPDGTVYALWVDKGAKGAPPPKPPEPGQHPANYDVVIARSTDGGVTFGAPVRANQVAGEVWAFPTAPPRLAISGRGTLHVFYTGNGISPANNKPVLTPLYTRSTDGGRSFTPGRPLAPVPPGDLSAFMHGGFAEAQTFGTIVAHGDTVQALWIDTRDMKTDTDNGALYTAISTDDGASFATESAIYDAVCPCCQITAAAGPGNTLFMGSREVTADGYRDSTVARSDDGGRTFGPRIRLGSERWQINGCPLKPTVVAVDGPRVYAAAYNGATDPGGVRFAASADAGRSFGGFDRVHPEAAVSDAPALVALPGGRLALAWHGKLPAAAGAPSPRTVFLRIGADNGQRWNDITPLSEPGSEAGYPTLATRRDGSIVALWVQGDRIVGTVIPPQQG